MKQTQTRHVLKILVIGNSGVGKTNMIVRFSEGKFMQSYHTTIGIDFKVKNIDMDDQKIKLQLWDTAGQEKFRTITKNYYRGAMGIIIAYDVTDMESFQDVCKWEQNANELSAPGIPRILVANKTDMPGRMVSTQQGLDLAQRYEMDFYEVSAKTNQGVDEMFMSMAEKVKRRIDQEQFVGAISYTGSKINAKMIKDKPKSDKDGGCC